MRVHAKKLRRHLSRAEGAIETSREEFCSCSWAEQINRIRLSSSPRHTRIPQAQGPRASSSNVLASSGRPHSSRSPVTEILRRPTRQYGLHRQRQHQSAPPCRARSPRRRRRQEATRDCRGATEQAVFHAPRPMQTGQAALQPPTRFGARTTRRSRWRGRRLRSRSWLVPCPARSLNAVAGCAHCFPVPVGPRFPQERSSPTKPA